MFNNLRDFEYKRSAEEALGFYLIYTLGLLVTLPAMGMLMASVGVLGNTAYSVQVVGGVMGCLVGLLYCLGFGVRILIAKRMETWHGWMLLLLAALAAVVHGVFGMGIVAYMTTRPLYWPNTKSLREMRRPRAAAAPRQAAAKAAQPAEGQGDAAGAENEEDKESDIVREYEEIMSKVGRKTVDRVRPDQDKGEMMDLDKLK